MILTHLAGAQLCPDYMGVELGIGESLIVKAIAQCTGRSAQQIKQDLIKVGDLGLVAEVCLSFSPTFGTRP
jgi:DNA ligase-1